MGEESLCKRQMGLSTGSPLAGPGGPSLVTLPVLMPQGRPRFLHNKQIPLPSGLDQSILQCRFGARMLSFHCILYPFKCSTMWTREEGPLNGEGPRLRQIPQLWQLDGEAQVCLTTPAPPPPPLRTSNHLFPLGWNQVLAPLRSLFSNHWWGLRSPLSPGPKPPCWEVLDNHCYILRGSLSL